MTTVVSSTGNGPGISLEVAFAVLGLSQEAKEWKDLLRGNLANHEEALNWWLDFRALSDCSCVPGRKGGSWGYMCGKDFSTGLAYHKFLGEELNNWDLIDLYEVSLLTSKITPRAKKQTKMNT